MTLQITPDRMTDLARIGRRDGVKYEERPFLVVEDSGAAIDLDSLEQHSQIPAVGEEHPRRLGMYATRSNRFEFLGERSKGVFFVEYSAREIDIGIEGNPDVVGFVGYSDDVDAQFVDVWRGPTPDPEDPDNIVIPVDGLPAEPPTDIKGRKLDAGGEPVSWLYQRISFEITNTLGYVPDRGIRVQMQGRRNDATFLGFPTGTLLFADSTVDRVADKIFRCTWRFVGDQYMHMRQQPQLDDEGSPVLIGEGTDPDIVHRARMVYWVQPHPILDDFDLLGITIPTFSDPPLLPNK